MECNHFLILSLFVLYKEIVLTTSVAYRTKIPIVLDHLGWDGMYSTLCLLYSIKNPEELTAGVHILGLHTFVRMLILHCGNSAEFPVIMQAIANCRPLTL